jgi:hypothetical protein
MVCTALKCIFVQTARPQLHVVKFDETGFNFPGFFWNARRVSSIAYFFSCIIFSSDQVRGLTVTVCTTGLISCLKFHSGFFRSHVAELYIYTYRW